MCYIYIATIISLLSHVYTCCALEMGILHKNPAYNSQFKTGYGFVNNLIDKLPIELHLPGYQFCGPGTKLQKRLQRGDIGINALDAACREHDIAYSQSKDINTRHQADNVLLEKAWQRVKSKDSDLKERANAWFVTNAMKTKVKFGMGNVLSKLKKIKKTKKNLKTMKKKKSKKVKLFCGGKLFKTAVKNGLKMLIKKRPSTFIEAYKIAHKAIKSSLKKKKKSKAHIPRVIPIPKTGGILPLIPILTALGALGGLASGGSAIAKAINDIKNGKEQLNEATRHNRYMESIAMEKGLFLKPYKQGYGLFLHPHPKN